MRKFPMPWLLWHACELVNYRLKTARFLFNLVLCLILTTLPSSFGRMGSVAVQTTKPGNCEAAGCQDCSRAGSTTNRPFFRGALARSVYTKILVDEEFKKFDRTKVNTASQFWSQSTDTVAPPRSKVTSLSLSQFWLKRTLGPVMAAFGNES